MAIALGTSSTGLGRQSICLDQPCGDQIDQRSSDFGVADLESASQAEPDDLSRYMFEAFVVVSQIVENQCSN